jgi:aminopeptidase-like protein
MTKPIGVQMHEFAKKLWPIHRSLACEGTRESLRIIQDKLPDLKIHAVASGSDVFDWKVPKEWNVREAWIKTPDGRKICDISCNNLHLVGYSVGVNLRLPLSKLNEHLHSLPLQPEALPYVTSYYNENWGFCISHDERSTLVDGEYEVYIDASLENGFLNYGELVLPGQSKEEIFLSTYVCHPSMANNELSGPVVSTYLAQHIQAKSNRRYTYRFVFIPETIGSIAYLSQHLAALKMNVVAGFNISCVGDDRTYSFLPSRNGKSLSDNIARHVLKWIAPDYKSYTWLQRGSDERQYCAPLVDLPIASIMRSKYGEYPEYHTSLDDLERVVTPAGLQGGLHALQCAVEALEQNLYPTIQVLGEPQLSKRGLYPYLSQKGSDQKTRDMMNVISYCDGKTAMLEIAEICNMPIWKCFEYAAVLQEHGLIVLSETAVCSTGAGRLAAGG